MRLHGSCPGFTSESFLVRVREAALPAGMWWRGLVGDDKYDEYTYVKSTD